jgi:NTP pyrophosphatase (non-canonical NTP hydrolase)
MNGKELAQQALELCNRRGWDLHWSARGVYLHLEASELIEALRGKGGDPLQEAADVLIVLMSITESNGFDWGDVERAAADKIKSTLDKPRYKGEFARGQDFQAESE